MILLTSASWLNGANTSAQVPVAPSLRVLPRESNGWFRVEAAGVAERVYTLQASGDLAKWTTIATAHDGLLPFPDPASSNISSRFYRVLSAPRTSGDDGKNQIQFPNDGFLSPFSGQGDEVRWLKFAILTSDPTRVYFQDSRKYLFHYDFAAKRLEPFIGMSRAAFDEISLRLNGQRTILGAVLFPPVGKSTEYGIQFVGLDPYPKEMIVSLFELVKSVVAAGPNVKALYLPAFEQTQSAETDRRFYEAHGIVVSTIDRWLPGNQTYSEGWAIGRLQFFPASEIADAFAKGLLLPNDILLTDGVPAEIPILAGVISLAPSTPNSHVAILARSFGIPFVHLVNYHDREMARQLAGREIVLRAGSADTGGKVDVIPLDLTIDPALKTELLGLKTPPVIDVPRKERYGAVSASTENLTPSDIKYFGGKAANFGLLRQGIPANSPVAMAFSFDVWDSFLDQLLPSGKTLRTEIQQRLAGFSYPPSMPALSSALAEIRKLITDTARFSPPLQQAITDALKGFDSIRNIRFRSSTNMEDSEQFTGAGLYDSFSGCLADDLDGDTTGPSRCDPSESKERGVFRAIQKVYASFYNDNAYLERLRHGVSENDVGMGLLVHHSFPDEIEMANGVATLHYNASPGYTNITAELVTQLGAASVSNPDSSARPEIVTTMRLSGRTYFDLAERSSLVPLGGHVMEWETDYQKLINLLYTAADRFSRYYPGKKTFTLDFEYKKEQPGALSVKQIRELPQIPTSGDVTPFLLNQTNRFEVFQGEFGDVFANHRLKSELFLQTRNLRLVDSDLNRSVYSHAEIHYVDGPRASVAAGSLASFPNASFKRAGDQLSDHWSLNGAENPSICTLTTEIRKYPNAPEKVILTLSDFALTLGAEFATPVPILEYDGPKMISKHTVRLRPSLPPDTAGISVQRTLRGEGGLEIQTRFFWQQPPGRGIGNKTADLLRWDETTITGLTSQPITLRGYYSQTYRPGHHNFWEEFIFEPRLEKDIPAEVLAELKAQNILFLYVVWGEGTPVIQVLGYDGEFRSLGGESSKP